mgnify:CR=1 FL=1
MKKINKKLSFKKVQLPENPAILLPLLAVVTILVIEHDMAFVRQIAHRVTVLHLGKVFAQGSIDDITADPRVAKIYLGEVDA